MPWFILSLVAFYYFTLLVHRLVTNYVLPSIQGDLGFSETQLGWLLPAFVLPYGLSQLFMGYLGDRFRRRRILLWSLSGSILIMCVMAAANSFWQLVALRIILGLVQAPTVPAIGSIVADCFAPRIRSTAVSIYSTSFTFGMMVSGVYAGKLADIPSWTPPIIGDFVGELTGWRIACFVFGLLGVVTWAVLAVLLIEPQRTGRKEGQGLGEGGANIRATLFSVLKVPSFLILGLIFGVLAWITATQDAWLAKYLHDSFGMSQGEAGEFIGKWMRISIIPSQLLGGFLADYWSRRWRGGRASIGLIGAGIFVPTLLVMGMTESEGWFAASMLLFGVALGFYVANLWTTTMEVVDPAARSTCLGLLNVFGAGASLAGPFYGKLMDAGVITNYGTAFTSTSVAAVLMVILFLVHIFVTLPRDFIEEDQTSEAR